MHILRHIRAILLLPFLVIIVIPGALVLLTGAVAIGWGLTPPLNLLPPFSGLLLTGIGLLFLVRTISMFARRGKGTLAPWDETQKLVVHGVYRYMRNPMISGVFCILAGEAVLFGSLPIFCWFLFFLIGNLIYIPLSEEPGLDHRFGDDYRRYKANVPRWIPRLKPWQPPASHEGRSED